MVAVGLRNRNRAAHRSADHIDAEKIGAPTMEQDHGWIEACFGIGGDAKSPTYRELYDGDWQHP